MPDSSLAPACKNDLISVSFREFRSYDLPSFGAARLASACLRSRPALGKDVLVKHWRFSVATGMVAVGYVAIGFAALKSPTRLWVNTMFSLAIALLAIAALGGLYRRPFLRGFALVGGGYLVLALWPSVSEKLGSRLLTTTALIRIFDECHYTPKEKYETVWWDADEKYETGFIIEIDHQSTPPKYRIQKRDGEWFSVHPTRFRPIDPESYWVLGHSFFCPIVSCIGGIIAQRFAARCAEPGRHNTDDREELVSAQ